MKESAVTSRLDGKAAVVTGSTMGIGRATATALAEAGARVIVHGRSAERSAIVAGEIRRAGGEAAVYLCELEQPDAARRLIEFALETYGRIDILVNNARTHVPAPITELREADWDLSLDVMLKAIYLCCKHAIPAMTAEGGAIVNVSSVHGYLGFPRHPAYAAAKAAVINLSRQLAVEYGPHRIRVNAVCPGGVVTERTAEGYLDEPWIDSEQERRQASVYPLRRFGRPREIAEVIAFLVSESASFVTGHALVVDGGLTARLPDYSLIEEHLREFPPG
jgi:NAD(P)-dependent dehydrogenase (short-subunit alcohol dehydrogenase family)